MLGILPSTESTVQFVSEAGTVRSCFLRTVLPVGTFCARLHQTCVCVCVCSHTYKVTFSVCAFCFILLVSILYACELCDPFIFSYQSEHIFPSDSDCPWRPRRQSVSVSVCVSVRLSVCIPLSISCVLYFFLFVFTLVVFLRVCPTRSLVYFEF